MPRAWVTGTLAAAALGTAAARAQDALVPAILPPAGAEVSRPPLPAPAVSPVVAPDVAGPVVAGAETGTAPRPSRVLIGPTQLVVPGIGPLADASDPTPLRPPVVRAPVGLGTGAGGAVVLSPTIGPPLDVPPARIGVGPGSPADAVRGEPFPVVVEPARDGLTADHPPSATTSERRPGPFAGLIGRLAGRLDAAGTLRPGAVHTPIAPPDDPDDPSQLLAMKRAIERRIVDLEGGRIAALEVLIVDRRIHIRARADRLWHRNAVRRTLESLAMPDGFRTSVEVR